MGGGGGGGGGFPKSIVSQLWSLTCTQGISVTFLDMFWSILLVRYMGLNKCAIGYKEANMQYYLYLPFYLNIKCILIMYFCASIVSAVFEECT